MIEAAIVGRPVFTLLPPEFHTSQLGTFHFEYVLDFGGGFVRTARTFEDHRTQLRDLLTGASDGGVEDGRRFVASFVRPLGLDRAAAPVFADVVEAQARAGARPPAPEDRWVLPLRALLLPGLARVFAFRLRLKVALEARRLLGRSSTAASAGGGADRR
jgi:hypothetical protein